MKLRDKPHGVVTELQMSRGVEGLDQDVQDQLCTRDQTGRQSGDGGWSRDSARKRHCVDFSREERGLEGLYGS